MSAQHCGQPVSVHRHLESEQLSSADGSVCAAGDEFKIQCSDVMDLLCADPPGSSLQICITSKPTEETPMAWVLSSLPCTGALSPGQRGFVENPINPSLAPSSPGSSCQISG